MKPQLTVLIPMVGLTAYLIFKPSRKVQETVPVSFYKDHLLIDSLQIDSLAVHTPNKPIYKTKE